MNCEWDTAPCTRIAIAYIIAGCLSGHLFEYFLCQDHLDRFKHNGAYAQCNCGSYFAEYMYRHCDGTHWHLEITQGSWNL